MATKPPTPTCDDPVAKRPKLQPLSPDVTKAAKLLQAANDPDLIELTPEEAKQVDEWIRLEFLPYIRLKLAYDEAKALGTTGIKPPVPPEALEAPPVLLGFLKGAYLKNIQKLFTGMFNNARKRLKSADFEVLPWEEAKAILESDIVQKARTQIGDNIREAKAKAREDAKGRRNAALAVANVVHSTEMNDIDKKLQQAIEKAKRMVEAAKQEAAKLRDASRTKWKTSKEVANNELAGAVNKSPMVINAIQTGKETLAAAQKTYKNAELTRASLVYKKIANARKRSRTDDTPPPLPPRITAM